MPRFGSRFSDKGFVLSTDILLAAILAVSFASIAVLTSQQNQAIAENQTLNSASTDAAIHLDETGFVFNTLDTNGLSDENKMQAVFSQLTEILPKRTAFRIELDEYAYAPNACHSNQSFSDCFSLFKTYPSAGSAVPNDKIVSYQESTLYRKGANMNCAIQGGYISLDAENSQSALNDFFAPIPKNAFFSAENKPVGNKTIPDENAAKNPGISPAINRNLSNSMNPDSDSKKSFLAGTGGLSKASFSSGTALFSAAADANIVLSVSINPSQNLVCDQDIRVDLNVHVMNFGRPPVDVVMVMDRSGSMSWDGEAATTNAYDTVVDANIAYLADGNGGVRTIDVNNPKLPLLMSVYNTPGTAYDVAQDANKYVYVADGTGGFRIVNATNPNSLSSVSALTQFQPANGVDVNNNLVYLATTSVGVIYDVTTTTSTPNTDFSIGLNATTDTNAGQSFITRNGVISGVELRLRRVANPAADLNVHLRSSYNGTDLASIRVTAASLTTSYAAYQLNFPVPVSVTPNETYFVVLTTAAISATNYYQWGARSGNPYSNGAAYKNNAAQTSDLLLRTYTYGGLQVINAVNKSAPVLTGTYRTTDAQDAAVSGNYLYLADGVNGLKIFDISTPQTPAFLGQIDTTDALHVAVSGDYAFVADSASGLRIVNISNPASPAIAYTFNTPGAAYDVTVKDNTAYVADNTSLQVIDVTNPSLPVLTKSFATTYNYRGLFVQKSTAYLASQSQGFITLDLNNGPRIDQSKSAGSFMLDYNFWKPQDQLALVSFNTSATLDKNLTNNRGDVNAALYSLIASGGTDIESGIRRATTELTTGVNRNPSARKFQVLMSDGQSNAGNSLLAAQDANAEGITIFTVAFGADASVAELAAIANATGGTSYIASDQNSLAALYLIIAEKIGEIAAQGNTQTILDSNLLVPIPNGVTITDFDGGAPLTIGSQNYVYYFVNDLNSSNTTWSGYFVMQFDCNNSATCSDQNRVFPPQGTVLEWKDINGIVQNPLPWDANIQTPVQYRDLTLTVLGADSIGNQTTLFDFNAINDGYLSTPTSQIEILKGNPKTGTLLATVPVSAFACGQKQNGCGNYFELLFDNSVKGEGNLYAVINRNGLIAECPNNNALQINCSSLQSRYLVMRIWMWNQ